MLQLLRKDLLMLFNVKTQWLIVGGPGGNSACSHWSDKDHNGSMMRPGFLLAMVAICAGYLMTEAPEIEGCNEGLLLSGAT